MITEEEREALREVARRLLEKDSSPARVRATIEDAAGYDQGLWRAMSDLGWLGLTIPEEQGGAGHSFAELAVVLEELGRHITPGPFFSTVVLGVGALLASGNERQQAELLPGIASGTTRVALVMAPPTGGTGKRVEFRTDAGRYRVGGIGEFALDAHTADVLIAAAQDESGATTLFVVPASADGVDIEVLPSIDATRRLCNVTFDLSVGEEALLGERGGGGPVLERLVDRAAAALAADSVGGAQRVLEMCVDYAKQRVQFGRPIGSFQAIKHRCADMLLLVETSRVAAERAAEEVAESPREPSEAAAIAKAYACDAYAKVGGDGIQLHGGIGFTWEHDIHLYFKRAKLNQALFGDSSWHRERLAAMVLPS